MSEQLMMEELETAVEAKPKRTRKTAEPKATEEKAEKATTKTTKTTTAKKTTKKAEETVEKVEEVDEKPAKKTAEKATTAKKITKKAEKSSAQEFLGTGKRKSSVARVRLSVGTGKFTINDRDIKEYFDLETLIYIAKQPLTLTEYAENVDVRVNVYGGGTAGQAGAIRHGLTKALLEFKPELRPTLKKAGFITRDARIKERKKYDFRRCRKDCWCRKKHSKKMGNRND